MLTAMDRFRRAVWIGSVLAMVVFVALLLRAPTDPRTDVLGNIHDVQARALFDGRWNMPATALAIEGFNIDGKFHTYFGPWPTVLRMPILLVTDRFDGALTGPSMLAALAVLLAACAALQRRIWATFAAVAEADPTLGVASAIAAMQFIVGAGSIVVFLGSRPLIYHEMELWGIAGAVLSTATVVRFAADRTAANAARCCGAATITLLSRPSTGMGVIVTLVLVLIAYGSLRTSTKPSTDSQGRASRPVTLALAAAIALPVLLYGAVNIARFGAPFALPLEQQVFTALDHRRQVVLADNNGSMFGAKFAPTTVVQYLRPDALRIVSEAPFVTFPRWRATVIGDATFDTLDRASSIPSSMPGITLLAGLGTAALLQRRRRNELLRTFGPVVLGGAVGFGSTIAIAFVAHRYLADAFPPLIVLALLGMHALLAAPRHRTRSIATAVITVACVAGCWISLGLGVVFQRDLQCGDPGYGRGTEPVVCAPR